MQNQLYQVLIRYRVLVPIKSLGFGETSNKELGIEFSLYKSAIRFNMNCMIRYISLFGASFLGVQVYHVHGCGEIGSQNPVGLEL